jgi:hypothetical protein
VCRERQQKRRKRARSITYKCHRRPRHGRDGSRRPASVVRKCGSSPGMQDEPSGRTGSLKRFPDAEPTTEPTTEPTLDTKPGAEPDAGVQTRARPAGTGRKQQWKASGGIQNPDSPNGFDVPCRHLLTQGPAHQGAPPSASGRQALGRRGRDVRARGVFRNLSCHTQREKAGRRRPHPGTTCSGGIRKPCCIPRCRGKRETTNGVTEISHEGDHAGRRENRRWHVEHGGEIRTWSPDETNRNDAGEMKPGARERSVAARASGKPPMPLLLRVSHNAKGKRRIPLDSCQGASSWEYFVKAGSSKRFHPTSRKRRAAEPWADRNPESFAKTCGPVPVSPSRDLFPSFVSVTYQSFQKESASDVTRTGFLCLT